MSIWSCVVPAAPGQTIAGLNAGMLVGSVVLVVWIGALAVAPFLSIAYRRYVTKLMRLEAVDSPAPGPGAGELRRFGMSWQGVLRRGLERQRVAAVAVCAATAAFVGASALVSARLKPAAPLAQDLAFALLLAVLCPAYIAMPRRYRLWWLALGIALATAATLAAGSPPSSLALPSGASVGEWTRVVAAYLVGWVAPMVAFALFAFRRSALGVAMPLLLAACVALVSTGVMLGMLEAHASLCVRGEGGNLGTAAAYVATLIAGWWIGLACLRACARAVRRGICNEVSGLALLALGVVSMFVLAGAQPTPQAQVPWTAAGWEIPLCVGAAVLAYALVIRALQRSSGPEGPLLLMLRVFAADKASHRLLGAVQDEWRFMGPVYQIGGPDLVAANIDPDECAAYLGGNLHELFLPAAVGDEEIRARMQTRADWEGRFGIHEVFCFNTAWRSTVRQLMCMSDVILLDVRGMNARREGTTYEIGLLAQLGLLPRVLAVGDASTDWPHIEAALRSAGGDPRLLKRLLVKGKGHAASVVRELADLAEQGLATGQALPLQALA